MKMYSDARAAGALSMPEIMCNNTTGTVRRPQDTDTENRCRKARFQLFWCQFWCPWNHAMLACICNNDSGTHARTNGYLLHRTFNLMQLTSMIITIHHQQLHQGGFYVYILYKARTDHWAAAALRHYYCASVQQSAEESQASHNDCPSNTQKQRTTIQTDKPAAMGILQKRV